MDLPHGGPVSRHCRGGFISMRAKRSTRSRILSARKSVQSNADSINLARGEPIRVVAEVTTGIVEIHPQRVREPTTRLTRTHGSCWPTSKQPPTVSSRENVFVMITHMESTIVNTRRGTP